MRGQAPRPAPHEGDHLVSARVDHSGRRFGHLVAQQYLPKPAGKWRCLCDCGEVTMVGPSELVKGKTRSCGCYRREVLATSGFKHGGCGSPAWSSWRDMHKRCSNPRAEHFKDYGGRGITVCARWSDFANFLADMGERPAGMTIERSDVNGNYEPGNCEWLPSAQQANNTRRTIRVDLFGRSMSLAEACALLNVPYNRTRDRMKTLGWSFALAVSEPKKVNGTMYATEVQP